MPSSDSPEVIVARYLKSNNYQQTLSAFLNEAGLPPDAGSVKAGDWTLEKILEEKKQFDTSLAYEKVQENEGAKGWTTPAPSRPLLISPPSGVANVLCVMKTDAGTRRAEEGLQPDQLLVSFADKTIHAILFKPEGSIKSDWRGSGASPILSITPGPDASFYTTEMSGKLSAWTDNPSNDLATVQSSRQDHRKFAVHATTYEYDGFRYIATAGWDQKVYVYRIPNDSHQGQESLDSLEEPSATLSFSTNPECLLFVVDPDTKSLHLIVSRRDSTHLYFHKITSSDSPTPNRDSDSHPDPTATTTTTSSTPPSITATYTGRQNLAPHSNAWISFTPSHFLPSPLDPTLLAIVTSHVPHMKLLILRLIFPSSSPTPVPDTPTASTTLLPQSHQAAQAHRDLALQNLEAAAIHLHVSTMAPQTPYSTPQVAWRPDGTGVWVNGDDGVVRGLDVTGARPGKVATILGGPAAGGEGHDPGSKIRSLWAGELKGWGEVVVSGGFDKRVIVWRV